MQDWKKKFAPALCVPSKTFRSAPLSTQLLVFRYKFERENSLGPLATHSPVSVNEGSRKRICFIDFISRNGRTVKIGKNIFAWLFMIYFDMIIKCRVRCEFFAARFALKEIGHFLQLIISVVSVSQVFFDPR